MYFGRHIEEAIVEYNTSTDDIHRERLFEGIIYPALSKLVEHVIHNRKFYDYGYDDYASVKHDCIVHLHTKLGKYSLEKGKAFSYFNRITIHWIFAYQNKLAKEKTLFPDVYTEDGMDRPSVSDLDKNRDLIREECEEEYKSELAEFLAKWADWGNSNLDYFFFVRDEVIVPFSFKEQQIANVIFDLCKHCHGIDNYDKKEIYFWIREHVECKTQMITSVVNVLKDLQKRMYMEYKKTGTKYWHRFLYYPDGIGEWSDEKIEEIVDEKQHCSFPKEYW